VGSPRVRTANIVADPAQDCGQHGHSRRQECHNRAVSSAGERRERVGRLAAGVIALAAGLGTLAVPYGDGPRLTTYAERSGMAETLFVTAGLGLVVAGLVPSFARPRWRIGDLAMVAGFLWFAPAWVGWDLGPPLVQSLAMVAAAFLFPVVVHLVLAFPSERVRPRAARVLVGAAYVEAGLAALGSALFRDPFFDPACWANCIANVFLVRSLPRLAHAIQVSDRWFVAVAAVALVAMCVWRIVRNSGPARRVLVPVAGPGIVFATAVVAHAIAVQRVPVEDPSDPVFLGIFLVACVAMILLAAGLLWDVQRTRAQRRSVARIVASLGEAPAPGTLESALARAIGDPDLRIAYRLSDPDRYVDANGRPVPDPAAAPGQVLTALVREGRRVAVVSHTAALPELEREVGAAVRLGLENERMQAESLSRLEELRESRARIVETADAERRRLERDLHDGAQQRFLALSYEIRLARAGAKADADARTEALLEEAIGESQAALGELRDLAHGIYPAILAEAGLGPALATLADAAPLPVEIRDVAAERYPAPVETAAYLLVTEALDDAARRGASHAAVDTVRDDDRLVVTVEDDGSDRDSALVRLADRVGAVGGTLEVEPTRLQGKIPCA
jgi:signal transduction histidine kinase